MSESGAPDFHNKFHSHNESQSNPASSMTSVGPDSRDPRQRVVDIDKMRSESLELVDQYDAIARELRRLHIPLKKSWETISDQPSTCMGDQPST